MTNSKMRKQEGFSLIELLIVVAIILIIAAIAIPNLLRAKMAANESSAVGSIRTINTAEITYASAYPTVGFAPDLASLGSTASPCHPSQTSACLIDSVLSHANTTPKSGYTFNAAGNTGGSGSVGADHRVFNRAETADACLVNGNWMAFSIVGNIHAAAPPGVSGCIECVAALGSGVRVA